MELHNFRNVQYFADIYLGSHKQKMTVDLDTGSHLLWIPTIDCKNSQGEIFCHKENDWYDYTQSTLYQTENEMKQINYAKGKCEGVLGTDFISINQITVPQEDIVFVYSEDQHIRQSLKSDGILGLSNYKKYNNFLDTSYELDQIDSPLFTFDLNWHDQESQFYYGKIPFDIMNNSVGVKVEKNNYWAISIINFLIDDISVQSYITSNTAVIDSGTSYFLIGQMLFQQIWKKLEQTGNCFSNPSFTSFTCRCKEELNTYNYPILTIYSQGAKFELTADDYLDKEKNGEYCILQIRTLPGEFPLLLFGDTFMRKYTTTYDKQNNMMYFLDAEKLDSTILVEFVLFTLLGQCVILLSVGAVILMEYNSKEDNIQFKLKYKNVKQQVQYNIYKQQQEQKKQQKQISYIDVQNNQNQYSEQNCIQNSEQEKQIEDDINDYESIENIDSQENSLKANLLIKNNINDIKQNQNIL